MDKPTIPQTGVALIGTLLDPHLSSKGLPPLFSISFGAVLFGDSILTRVFVRKVQRWFQDYENVTQEEFDKLMHKVGENKEEFWANTVKTIDELDSEEKASLGNNLFKALIRDKISFREYQRLVNLIKGLHFNDLQSFRFNHASPDDKTNLSIEYDPTLDPAQEKHVFVTNGLLLDSLTVKAQFATSPTKHNYNISHLGKLLLEFGFKDCTKP